MNCEISSFCPITYEAGSGLHSARRVEAMTMKINSTFFLLAKISAVLEPLPGVQSPGEDEVTLFNDVNISFLTMSSM